MSLYSEVKLPFNNSKTGTSKELLEEDVAEDDLIGMMVSATFSVDEESVVVGAIEDSNRVSSFLIVLVVVIGELCVFEESTMIIKIHFGF